MRCRGKGDAIPLLAVKDAPRLAAGSFTEHQLAHAVRDPNGRAYNRTAHLAERKKMMQTWADYLDGLKVGAKVLPFKKTTV